MPFTFSHPAVVLPLIRSKYVSATGLIMGSIIPDFEYFLRMKNLSEHSHTWAGAFYFDLPLTLLIALIFHLIIKKPLIDNLPVYWQERFQETRNSDFITYLKSNLVVFIISALIGSFSHIIWDSFTHSDRFFVDQFVFLQDEIQVGSIEKPAYKFMQHGSTLAGLVFVLGFIHFMKRHPVTNQKEINLSFWLVVIGITLMGVLIRLSQGFIESFYTNLIITIISAGMIGLLAASIVEERFRSSAA